jgi:hypothetical protein
MSAESFKTSLLAHLRQSVADTGKATASHRMVVETLCFAVEALCIRIEQLETGTKSAAPKPKWRHDGTRWIGEPLTPSDWSAAHE